MKKFLYFATGDGANLRGEAYVAEAGSIASIVPVTTTTTAVYFNKTDETKRRYTPYGSTVKGDYYKQIVKDPKFVDKLRGIFRGSQDLLSPISDSLQKGGSFKGGMEELQSAMMLPMLLQQLLGE